MSDQFLPSNVLWQVDDVAVDGPPVGGVAALRFDCGVELAHGIPDVETTFYSPYWLQ